MCAAVKHWSNKCEVTNRIRWPVVNNDNATFSHIFFFSFLLSFCHFSCASLREVDYISWYYTQCLTVLHIVGMSEKFPTHWSRVYSSNECKKTDITRVTSNHFIGIIVILFDENEKPLHSNYRTKWSHSDWHEKERRLVNANRQN